MICGWCLQRQNADVNWVSGSTAAKSQYHDFNSVVMRLNYRRLKGSLCNGRDKSIKSRC